MATIAATNPPPPPPGGGGSRSINADALKCIDINRLSQSELQALSLTSNSAFDVRRTDDVVFPILDRSIFNESAGSRRQTYSRLHHRSHSRFPGLHPSVKPQKQFSPSSDPVTHSIVHYFKHLLDGNHNPPPPPVPQPQAEEMVPELGLEEKESVKPKRKRAKKGKKKKSGADSEVELRKVNGKGVVVDFGELERNGDELYEGELKKWTGGLESEEAVLEFLSDLDGQWCSRRRRRKYVDAGMFGDALPVGWKLLLGLRRRDYRVSVYCRRFVSPTGQQFISCREAASFLTSYFGGDGVGPQRDLTTCSIQQAYVMSSVNNKHSAERPDQVPSDLATQTAASNSSNGHQNDEHLMGIENLPDVKVRDIFECVKCNLSFDEKNVYLQHLFAYHQKTTKRYRVGTSVGEGVIIRDGKFECQFCHKVFVEKRSYSGHVGIHVRSTGKNTIELPTPVTVKKHLQPTLQSELPYQPLQLELPSQPLKMDATVEIPQMSTAETLNKQILAVEIPQMSTAETLGKEILAVETPQSKRVLNNQSANVSNLGEPQVACSIDDDKAMLSSDAFEVQTEGSKLTPDPAIQIEGSTSSSVPVGIQSEDSNLNFVPVGVRTEEFNADHSLSEQFNHIVQGATENNDMVRNDYHWDIDINMDANSFSDSVHVIEEYGNSNLGMGIGQNDHLEDTPGLNDGDMVFQDRDSSVPLAQSFDFFPSYDSASHKEHEFPIVHQKLENVTGFEELRFDDIESFKYGFTTGQELPSLPGCSMNFDTDGRIEDGFDSSVRFQPQEVMSNTVETSHLTVCVWCTAEFRLEGIELETPSDSIGYMCPTCKARISGHFSAGLSMGHTGF